ncbi:S8 family serine peptidase [Shewanella litorisediminis]|uniref:S8 family serine peptidase n=1 Tax=Shewanella litorisediminis TaxID=1173586 RepID=A0ABX7FYP2_9GAMM|nr:S8 family serine peptidase [Shewanella litorisediminis]MCL2919243.1 S8 family serine peptidase [Shewanella litorisediminis]QRH00162.1 S8 family serine peptidase [Shewanella litorisediminis]
MPAITCCDGWIFHIIDSRSHAVIRLTLLAAAVISSYSWAEPAEQKYLAQPLHTEMKPLVSQKQRYIDDLYFMHFPEAPLALAYKQLPDTSIMVNGKPNGRLNVASRSSQQYLQKLANGRDIQRQRLSSVLGRNLNFEYQYGLLINAATVRLTKEEAAKLEQSNSGVRLEKMQMRHLMTDAGPSFIGGEAVWNGVGTDLPTKGEGVIVGVIDTGIDADHPSFTAKAIDGYEHVNPWGTGNYTGDCVDNDWLCNDKLIGVVSYPELRGFYPGEPYEGFPKPEVIDVGWDMHGHGTHVASTVAGNPQVNLTQKNAIGDEAQLKIPKISGVAPRANIISYQVCLPISGDDPNYGGCFPDLTVLALEHAVQHGVHVINYSVGGAPDSPWDSADSLAFLAARTAGIHAVTAAGNAGPSPQTVGAPGNAPWVTTVAAYTHDRGYSDKTLRWVAGGESALADISGAGVSYGLTGQVVDAANYNDGKCNSPFEAGTFNGEIVVCRRGDIARVEKGNNVLAGGAGGLILINVDANADNIEPDLHVLPAIQLTMADGETLLSWLGSGSDHALTISESAHIRVPENGDIAGSFSSRGPNYPYPHTITPDIAAPGVDIFAAHTTEWPFVDPKNAVPSEFDFMSGTSMASPHVAGALALLAALRPDWTPSEAQSAIMTTANSNTFKDDDGDGVKESSTPFDAGAGRIQIDKAVQAGLLLPISEAEYLNADPALNGNPATLNLPTMVGLNCLAKCEWTRTVTAVKDATWTVTTALQTQGVNVSVTPSTFALKAGESQQLTITATPTAELAALWSFGEVRLTSSGLPEQHLTFAAEFTGGNVPTEDVVKITAHRDADNFTLAGFNSIGSDNLQVEALGLSKVDVIEGETSWDPTANYRAQNPETYHVVPVNTNSSVTMIGAWINSAEAPDLDLFIVRDANLDGKPSQIELDNAVCISGREDSKEACFIDTPVPANYLVVVHNYQGTDPANFDKHSVSVVKVRKTDTLLEADVPESVAPGEEFALTLNWDQPMSEGEVYFAVATLGTHPNLPDNIGSVYFELHRGADDVAVTVDRQSIVSGDTLTYSIDILANDSAADKVYTLTTTLADGFSVLDADGGTQNGNTITWQLVQEANGPTRTLALVVGSAGVTKSAEIALEIIHSVDSAPGKTLKAIADAVQVKALPIAKINGSSAAKVSLQTPGSIDLSGADSFDGDGKALSYQWRQVSGPTLTMSGNNTANLKVSIAALQSQAVAVIELVAESANGKSAPAQVTVQLLPEQQQSSGGGALGLFSLLFAFSVGFIRIGLRKKV